ncbi:zinc metalloproteinase-disintegrin-like lachestatin-2 [Xenopus tropicalis]|uniref:Zinc metalloproteinase-disintegrin-like lachestatin-2 n=1 Tax=Xenopus tropicalis TaxID=8364 RepID=A0A8J1JET8_XENTR|nr:zinc metalloproteinase-disintegrin-like lachestatin-2 [Xenopus tropicalis]
MSPSALLFAGLLTCQVLVLQISALPTTQRYEIVIPQKLHSQYKRDTQSMYPDVVQYEVLLENRPLVLHLEKTEGLIHNDFTETRYQQDGMRTTNRPEVKDLCLYQGQVKGDPHSLVSLSTCNGLSGSIMTQGHTFLIEPLKETDSEEHAFYEYDPKADTSKACGVTSSNMPEGEFNTASYTMDLTEKQEILNSSKYVQLYVVADYSMVQKYNGSVETIKNRIFQMMNYNNMVYKALNVFIALCGVEFWENGDQFPVPSPANECLGNFSEWRDKNLVPRKLHDAAVFLTNVKFVAPLVGLAYVGGMCFGRFSAGVINDYSKEATIVASIIAHEVGHNFGMNHDSTDCSCSSASCIMSKYVSPVAPTLFSNCSISAFQNFLLTKNPTCISDIPDKPDILTPPVCGNKFTEVGEDCDCGTVQECKNPCCDAATCKKKPNVQCTGGECCDNCMIKAAGHVCRASKGDCDLDDLCNGVSSSCPSDRFRVNGLPCNNGRGYCYNGSCPTMLNQCNAIWGVDSAVSGNSCFNMNTNGVIYGHCKQNGTTYVPCAAEDIMCGVLFCINGTTFPLISAPFVTTPACKALLSPAGKVQSGAKCGNGKVCSNNQCVTTETAYIGSSGCDSKCPKNAVCDHELICQCTKGWVPPNCNVAVTSGVISTSDQNLEGPSPTEYIIIDNE